MDNTKLIDLLVRFFSGEIKTLTQQEAVLMKYGFDNGYYTDKGITEKAKQELYH